MPEPTKSPEELYTVGSAAKYLGLSIVQTKRYIYEHKSLRPDFVALTTRPSREEWYGRPVILLFRRETLDAFKPTIKPRGRPRKVAAADPEPGESGPGPA